MDNLTHTLIGVAMGRAGLSARFGRGTTALMAIASNVPDVDVLVRFAYGLEAPAYRRTLSHSVVGAPLLAAAVAAVAGLRMRAVGWRARFGLALAAIGVHVLFDLVNSYGVVALWPASFTRFELAWVFIVDLAIWAILLLPLAPRSVLAFRLSLAALALYVGLCGAGRRRSLELLRAAERPGGGEPDWSYVFPEALGPHRWRGVTRRGADYRLSLVRPLAGEVELVSEHRTMTDDPAVRAVRETHDGRVLDWFFKAPVWRHDRAHGVVEVYDLRFRSTVLGGRQPFVYRFATPAPRGTSE